MWSWLMLCSTTDGYPEEGIQDGDRQKSSTLKEGKHRNQKKDHGRAFGK
jgi:hypothetical protein